MKILIPTDFSEQAEYAFLLVQKLAKKMEAEIHFLHVMNVPDTVTLDESGNVQTCGDIDPRYVENRKAIVDRKLADLKVEYGPAIHTKVIFGKTTDSILSYSTSHHFDLIVMGTKGAWGLKEMLSGSDTQQIARKSTIPLLSLKCDRSDLEINHILLVHDFMDEQNEEFPLLKKFQEAFGTKVHLLQIIDDVSEEAKRGILAKMEEYVRKNKVNNFEKHLIRDIDVENGVIHFNQMLDMDLICIGTHGRSGFSHFFKSSATEKVLNHLFKPIISFRLN